MNSRTVADFNRKRFNGRLARQLLPVVLSFIAGGCGNGTPHGLTIHGRVTYQGQPVEGGTLTFISLGNEPGRPASANIEDGAYSLLATEGLASGTYRVEIEGYRKTGKKVPDLATPLQPNQERAMIDERVPYLPTKFNQSSSLRAEIATDGQELNFDLQ